MLNSLLKSNWFQSKLAIILAPLFVLLTACGGSGGGSDTTPVNPIDPPASNTAPTLVITAPGNGTSIDFNQGITLTANANDAQDGDLSGNIVWRSSIDGELGAGASLFAELSVGNHTITASVTDSGNLSTSSSTSLTVNAEEIVENTPPQLAITAPESGSEFVAGSSVTLSANASDAEDGNIASAIAWTSSIDGELGSGASLVVNLSEGAHTITATVEDSEQLAASQSVEVTIQAAQPENTAPSINITSPANGSEFEEGTASQLTAEATDLEDGDLSGVISWSSNLDGDLGQGASLQATLSVGTHTLTASVTDSGELSQQANVTVQVNQAPAENVAPEVTITAPVSGGQAGSQDTITLTATASDEEDGDLSAVIQWYSDLDGFLGEGAEVTLTLTEGLHTITAQVSDSADANDSDQVTIDIVASSAMATVSWTAPVENTDDTDLTDLAGFRIYYGENSNNLDQVVEIMDPQATSYVIEQLATGTTYYFSVTAVNAFDVESDLSVLVSKDT